MGSHYTCWAPINVQIIRKCNGRDDRAATPATETIGNPPEEWLNKAPALGSRVLLCSNLVRSRVTCKHLLSAQTCTCPRAGRERGQTINQTNPSQEQNVTRGSQLPVWLPVCLPVCPFCPQCYVAKRFSSFITPRKAAQINIWFLWPDCCCTLISLSLPLVIPSWKSIRASRSKAVSLSPRGLAQGWTHASSHLRQS